MSFSLLRLCLLALVALVALATPLSVTAATTPSLSTAQWDLLLTSHNFSDPTLRAPAAASDPSAECSTCQFLVDLAGKAVQEEASMDAIAAALKAYCKSSSWEVLCTPLMKLVIKELPKVPAMLTKAGIYTPAIFCSALGQCKVPCCADNTPSQIRLSVAGAGADYTRNMRVSWSTLDDTADVYVQWGLDPSVSSMAFLAKAQTTSYAVGGWVGAVHTAVMDKGLQAGTTYYYRVGGPTSGWSAFHSFVPIGSAIATTERPFSMVVVGDMGAEPEYAAGHQAWINFVASANGARVQPNRSHLAVDMVMHVGDVGYADGYEERWDSLFNTMQPAATRVPYMTAPGNHECVFNFTAYRTRMHMPYEYSNGSQAELYYSWDAGCVHFISLNSESSINTAYISDEQVAWLKADLEKFHQRRVAGQKLAVDPLNAGVCSYDRPSFLVVQMHRPMYCSSNGSNGPKRCGTDAAYLQERVEALFGQYGVDLVLSGHVHAYERTKNVYRGKKDEAGPIYIMNGGGGNREGETNKWLDPAPSWSKYTKGKFGLGHLRVLNSTTLHWTFHKQTDLVKALEEGTDPKVKDEVFIRTRYA